MARIACEVAYDGTGFSGYQVQPKKRTVQGELEKSLQTIHKGEAIKAVASGRTDATVHAKGQVIHFDTSLAIPEQQWPKALNALLPDDIRVIKVSYVQEDFHARFSVYQKTYRYRVLYQKNEDVFRRHYVHHVGYPLDIEAMKEAARYLVGTYDFSSFCAANTDVKDKVRTLSQLELNIKQDELIFELTGNGFLYNMVRIIVGTLLEIGSGKRHPLDMELIRDGKSRHLAGKTAPGHGLYLWSVRYKEPIF